jgi:phage terminase large subunit
MILATSGKSTCSGQQKSRDRNIRFGPTHDWSSHGADGFGLMCIHYDQPEGTPPRGSSGGASGQSA